MTLLCLPIIGPTVKAAIAQTEKALPHANLLELRLDLFEDYDTEHLKTLRNRTSLPIIFTLRKASQGGSYQGSEETRLEKILKAAELHPDYLDLEYDTSKTFVNTLRERFPHIKIIVSYHDFLHTPDDLDKILQQIKNLPGDFYKISCLANSTNDSLRMLKIVSQHKNLLGMCMGEKGIITRILGGIFGSPWIFASIENDLKSAPGQITATEISSIYHAQKLNKKSALYGLIGAKIDKSISQITHNHAFHHCDINAVYVKMAVEKEELQLFFSLIQSLGFKGLSVTMPLKEAVIPFLTKIDDQSHAIGAVNTLVFQDGEIIGYNTDAKGALDAIEKKSHVKNKDVVVLGAGGAARAIAFEARLRGGNVLIVNRTKEKGESLAKELSIKSEASIPEHYDILINTAPSTIFISEQMIYPLSIIMDINAMPKMSPLLHDAKRKGCQLVFGYEMFLNQAIGQFRIWFPHLAESLANTILSQASIFK